MLESKFTTVVFFYQNSKTFQVNFLTVDQEEEEHLFYFPLNHLSLYTKIHTKYKVDAKQSVDPVTHDQSRIGVLPLGIAGRM